MRQFKFRDLVFGRWLPSWYKEHDTYKDEFGKGIVERFTNICEDYFDDEVNPEIDSFMDLIDIDKTPEIFINYLWEYFGFIPYAYGVVIKNRPYTKEDLQQWVLESMSNVPRADFRNLLKYAISLYKIRCTHEFYQILGKFYGFEINITEPGGTAPDLTGVIEVRYDADKKYDQTDIRYDHELDCLECVELQASVGLSSDIISGGSRGGVFLDNRIDQTYYTDTRLKLEYMSTGGYIYTWGQCYDGVNIIGNTNIRYLYIDPYDDNNHWGNMLGGSNVSFAAEYLLNSPNIAFGGYIYAGGNNLPPGQIGVKNRRHSYLISEGSIVDPFEGIYDSGMALIYPAPFDCYGNKLFRGPDGIIWGTWITGSYRGVPNSAGFFALTNGYIDLSDTITLPNGSTYIERIIFPREPGRIYLICVDGINPALYIIEVKYTLSGTSVNVTGQVNVVMDSFNSSDLLFINDAIVVPNNFEGLPHIESSIYLAFLPVGNERGPYIGRVMRQVNGTYTSWQTILAPMGFVNVVEITDRLDCLHLAPKYDTGTVYMLFDGEMAKVPESGPSLIYGVVALNLASNGDLSRSSMGYTILTDGTDISTWEYLGEDVDGIYLSPTKQNPNSKYFNTGIYRISPKGVFSQTNVIQGSWKGFVVASEGNAYVGPDNTYGSYIVQNGPLYKEPIDTSELDKIYQPILDILNKYLPVHVKEFNLENTEFYIL